MKKSIFTILAVVFVLMSFASFNNNKGNATVDQQEGLYIFMLSKPASEYDYLGSVKKGMALTGQPKEMLNSMIKKVKKDYPTANGIVFTTIQMEKADAIFIKDSN